MFGQVVWSVMGGVNLTGAEGNAVLYGGRAAKAGRAKNGGGKCPRSFLSGLLSLLPACSACFFLPSGGKKRQLRGSGLLPAPRVCLRRWVCATLGEEGGWVDSQGGRGG